MAYISSINGNPIVPSNGSVGYAQVARGYYLMTKDEKDRLGRIEEIAIANLNVTTEKIANGAVATDKLADGAVTGDKLATDLARDRERLLYRLDNLLTAQLPEGETATATDAARTPMAGLALYGRSTQDGTPTPSAPVPIVSVGAANLLPNHPQRIDSGKGITFTDNGDGSYGISGTATANTDIYLTNNDTGFTLPEGTYTLSARDANGANVAGVRAGASRWANGANTSYGMAEGSRTFTHTGEGNVQFIVEVTSGTTVNATIWPCLYAGTTAYPYVPYGNVGLWARRTSDASTYTVTPIDLQGHELRSLPDGTRDELAVDEWGHAVLTQRVGVTTITAFDGTNTMGGRPYGYKSISGKSTNTAGNSLLSDKLTTTSGSNYYIHNNPANVVVTGLSGQAQTDLGPAVLPLTVQYALATPVTIDLGYVAAVPLVGPDLTAQAIPTAPFALTYERDLNATLARLESAIATLA